MSRTKYLGVALASPVLALLAAGASASENIGTVRQPIVAGDQISVKRQHQLGLVTIRSNGGTCSGTLINEHWVLTADHCVTTNGDRGGPDQAFSKLRITAEWSSKWAGPTRYVRFWNSNSLDVALIFLGAGNLGPADRKLIYHNRVDNSMILTKLGQGLCSLASEGPPPQPAETDCGYRSAAFTPSLIDRYRIVLPTNEHGQSASGNDSGGPDFVTDGDGNLLAIAGVQSQCWASASVPDMGSDGRTDWRWVTAIENCTSAPLYEIRDDIHRAMEDAPVAVIAPPPASGVHVSPDTPAVTRARGPYTQ
jgi:hypothetical protein